MAETILEYNEFVLMVLDALEESNIPYLIGGAVAAWAWGEPRATRDLDLVVQVPESAADKLSKELEKRDMPLPAEIIRERVKDRRGDLPLNTIHGVSGYKADLYILREGDDFREEAFRRRVLVDLGPGLGEVYLHTPEDLIINKLLYYSISEQTKHIRDITSIVQTMGNQLDTAYIDKWVAVKELQNLWNSLQLQIQSID
ncbi:MAG: hypothetical protein WBB69_16105 [Anaerolineales bacterium]